MLKKFVFIPFVVITVIYFCTAAYGITVGPSRFEVRLPAGEIAGADYYVQNETDKPIHVTVEPENWFGDVYDYKGLSISDWIKFDTYEFDLKPKEIKKLRLTITVPTNVEGELVAQIFFASDKKEREDESTVSVRLGAVLYVAIKGTEEVAAKINGIGISKFAEGKTEGLMVDVKVVNKGNVHIRPTGRVTVEDSAGKKIAELSLPSSIATLPNQESSYYAFWKKPNLKEDTYKIMATIDYGNLYDIKKTCMFEKKLEVGKNGEVMLK